MRLTVFVSLFFSRNCFFRKTWAMKPNENVFFRNQSGIYQIENEQIDLVAMPFEFGLSEGVLEQSKVCGIFSYLIGHFLKPNPQTFPTSRSSCSPTALFWCTLCAPIDCVAGLACSATSSPELRPSQLTETGPAQDAFLGLESNRTRLLQVRPAGFVLHLVLVFHAELSE